MRARIGYLVPEFPGQTHTWIWRDVRALQELGVQADLVSTRRPAETPHAWAEDAHRQTRYLYPLGKRDVFSATRALASLSRSARCFVTLMEGAGVSLSERARMLGLLGFGAKLASLARRSRWSHLHVASLGDAALVAAFASMLARLPYSVTLLANLDHYGAHQRQKWQGAAFAIVMSEQLRRQVQSELGVAAPERIFIAPMGVDVEQWQRPSPYQVHSPGEPFRLYTCGRLNPSKGHEYLFDALPQLRDAGIAVQLTVAGAEQGVCGYHAELVARVRSHGLAEQVRFLGSIPEEEHRQQLLQAHAFVLPSLDEGISVAAMEAMALQVPTVATDVGGMCELIDSGVNGMLVAPGRPALLAQALRTLHEQPEMAAQLGRVARSVVVERFHHRLGARAMARGLRLSTS